MKQRRGAVSVSLDVRASRKSMRTLRSPVVQCAELLRHRQGRKIRQTKRGEDDGE